MLKSLIATLFAGLLFITPVFAQSMSPQERDTAKTALGYIIALEQHCGFNLNETKVGLLALGLGLNETNLTTDEVFIMAFVEAQVAWEGATVSQRMQMCSSLSGPASTLQ